MYWDKELKVLSYWNLNFIERSYEDIKAGLKVLSYWNLNCLTKLS